MHGNLYTFLNESGYNFVEGNKNIFYTSVKRLGVTGKPIKAKISLAFILLGKTRGEAVRLFGIIQILTEMNVV